MNKFFFIIDDQFTQKQRERKKVEPILFTIDHLAIVHFLKCSSLEFQNFKIPDILAINHKPDSCTDLVKPLIPGRSGIDVQRMIFRIENDFQNM